MPIRALVIEDESLAADKLRGLLQDENDIEVMGTCEDPQQALDKIQSDWPDVVFLDVQLTGDTGFTFLDSLAQCATARGPKIIFTTAHEMYAVRAFEASAVDFLLKPFSRERLRTAVQKLRKELERDQKEALTGGPEHKYVRQLAFKSRGRLVFTNVGEIEWISAEGNYVRIYAREQSHLIRGTVQAMEEKLDPKLFVRIHRSTIINLEFVAEMKPWAADGERIVTMKGGRARFQIGRNFRSRVTDLLNCDSKAAARA